MRQLSIVYCLLLSICSNAIFGQGADKDTDVYITNWQKDKYAIYSGAGLLTAGYLLNKSLPILTETEINALDRNDVLGLDRSAIDNYSQSAADVSDYFRDAIVLVPLTLFLAKKAQAEFADIGVMYLETFGITSGITAVVKPLARRPRPFVYNPDIPLADKQTNNATKSFYSGHTSHVTSLAFFTASVFEDLYPDSGYRYLVWAGAIAAPAITAYARYKAGVHFPTDVVVGYGVGAVIGYLIPKLHKRKAMENISLYGTTGGLGLTYQF